MMMPLECCKILYDTIYKNEGGDQGYSLQGAEGDNWPCSNDQCYCLAPLVSPSRSDVLDERRSISPWLSCWQ